MANKIIMKGRIRDGDEMIPFKIVWLTKSNVYELECEARHTAPPEAPFLNFNEALEYLVENYGSWSA